jgi:hypothetical protein
MAPGLREEDVVERRLVDLQLRQDDSFGVEARTISARLPFDEVS